MSDITGFGYNGVDVALSEDKTEVLITAKDAPQPMRYKIRYKPDGTLEIINLDDDKVLIEELEDILSDNIYAQENKSYGSYELMGMYEAAQDITKYIRENFVRKN